MVFCGEVTRAHPRLQSLVAEGARTSSHATPAMTELGVSKQRGRSALLCSKGSEHNGRKAEFTSAWSTRIGCPWQSSTPSCRVETAPSCGHFLLSASGLLPSLPQPAAGLLSVPRFHHRTCPPASLGERGID